MGAVQYLNLVSGAYDVLIDLNISVEKYTQVLHNTKYEAETSGSCYDSLFYS